MKWFRKDPITDEKISNPDGIKSVSFSDLVENGYSLSISGYTPDTGRIRVIIKKNGLESTCAQGNTNIKQGSKIIIANEHGALGCTGEVRDIIINYQGDHLQFNHAEAEKTLQLKSLLDRKHIRYENDPSLEVLKKKLDETTNNLMERLRK